MSYSEDDLAGLKDTVEQFLERDRASIGDQEYMYLYDKAERHYDEAAELMVSGRLDEAGYELEYAAAAAEVADGTVDQLAKGLDLDYRDFLDGDLF